MLPRALLTLSPTPGRLLSRRRIAPRLDAIDLKLLAPIWAAHLWLLRHACAELARCKASTAVRDLQGAWLRSAMGADLGARVPREISRALHAACRRARDIMACQLTLSCCPWSHETAFLWLCSVPQLPPKFPKFPSHRIIKYIKKRMYGV